MQYLRVGQTIRTLDDAGNQIGSQHCESINAAKRKSRELQKEGHVVKADKALQPAIRHRRPTKRR